MSQNIYLEEDEITLKRLFLKLKEFWIEFLCNWRLIVLVTLPFLLWFLYDAYSTPIEYNAELTFVINEENGGGGGIAGLAGQLGFNIGGGKGSFNKERLIGLSKSGKIIYPVILDSLEIEGVKDVIGNHLIRLYKLHDKWEDSPNKKLKGFFFKTNSFENLTLTDNQVLKACYRLIIGTKKNKALSVCRYNEDSGILNISSQSICDELSYGLTNKIFANLSSFYIKQQIEPQKKAFEALKAKADSISTLIRNKEYELASLRDRNKSVYLQKNRLREDRLQRELPVYASQYAALLQNVENADFVLKSSTPFFQVIDFPFFPLPVMITSKLKALAIGGFIGVLLASLFIFGRKIYIDTMSED